MDYLSRRLEQKLNEALMRQKSVLLLGPRQTGKTTLLKRLPLDLSITLAQPAVRQRYERNPGNLTGEIEALARSMGRRPLVVLDEVQKVPDLLDAAQYGVDIAYGPSKQKGAEMVTSREVAKQDIEGAFSAYEKSKKQGSNEII